MVLRYETFVPDAKLNYTLGFGFSSTPKISSCSQEYHYSFFIEN